MTAPIKERPDASARIGSIASLFRILRDVRPYARLLGGLQALALVTLAIGAAIPFSLKAVTTALQAGQASILLWVPALGLAAAILLALCAAARQMLSSHVSLRMMAGIQKRVYDHYLAMDVLYHLRTPTGEKMARVTFDTMWIVEGATILFSDVIFMPAMIVVYGTIMLATDWKLALMALVTFPVVLLASVLVGRRLRQTSAALQRQNTILSAHLAETLGAVMVVKVFRREEHESRRYAEHLREYTLRAILDAAWQAALKPFSRVATAACVCLVGWYAFRRLTITQDLEVANLVAFLGVVALFDAELRKIAPAVQCLARAGVSYERVDALLRMETAAARPGGRSVPMFRDGVAARGILFAYAERPVLRDVDIEIPRGTFMAISGLSGAGKTTLLRVLVGLLAPQAGTVAVDGTDLHDIDRESLRRLFSYVPQTSMLFNVSMRDNIAYGRSDATTEEVRRAAELACADEFIRNMPEGYDTQAGEMGECISAGQRQRIAIARALVMNAPIIVLDECFSNIDLITEQRVYRNLLGIPDRPTILIVTHRLSAVSQADRIVHLVDGAVAETGTHDELMRRAGSYHDLYMAQTHLDRLRKGAEDLPTAPAEGLDRVPPRD